MLKVVTNLKFMAIFLGYHATFFPPSPLFQPPLLFSYLEKHDSKEAEEKGQFRTSEEMESEARRLAELLKNNL